MKKHTRQPYILLAKCQNKRFPLPLYSDITSHIIAGIAVSYFSHPVLLNRVGNLFPVKGHLQMYKTYRGPQYREYIERDFSLIFTILYETISKTQDAVQIRFKKICIQ